MLPHKAAVILADVVIIRQWRQDSAMSGQAASGDDAVTVAIERACALFPPPPNTGANPYTEPRVEYLLKLSQLIEGRIVFEASWIGQRMSWLIISQSFLFGAFATAAAHPEISLLTFAKWLIPVIAGIQVVFTYIAIVAAKEVGVELARMRGVVDAAIKGLLPGVRDGWTILGVERFGRASGTYWRGGLAGDVIPITLLVAWATLLVYMCLS